MRRPTSSFLVISLFASALHAGCGGSDSSSDQGPSETLPSGTQGSGGKASGGATGGKAGGAAAGMTGKGGAAATAGGAGAAGGAGSGGAGAAGGAGAGGDGGKAGAPGGAGAGGAQAGGSAGAQAGGAGGVQAAGAAGAAGAPVDPILNIQIEPESPVIEVINGVVPPPLQMVAKAVKQSGAEQVIQGTWSIDDVEVASINAGSGALTATGLHGGKATVSFEGAMKKAATTVTVKLSYSTEPSPVSPDVKAALQNPAGGADPSLSLLYPYDQTVFPRGLAGPELQWSGAGGGDTYRLQATTDTFSYEAYFTAPEQRFAFPEAPDDIWKKLTSSVAGTMQVSLTRYDGATAYQPRVQTWRIATANLAGTIYYTKLVNGDGDVLRLSPGAKAPESFLQKNGRCVACHTVSSNGQRLVAGFDGGASPWGVFDAATGALLYDSGQASGFQAMSPDGQYVLYRHWADGGFGSEGLLRLSAYNDATTLATLSTGAGAPSHPAWSHDGSRIALANRTDGNGLDFSSSSLWLANVTTSPPQFADIKEIVPNDGNRPTVTFPTFSPDSKWIAFMRATQARTQSANGELWLTDGNGSTFPLDALNGAGYLSGNGGDANRSFEPSFLPLPAGGYFWVVFSTTRAYGNRTSTGTRLQLWVAAIEQNPQPGQDPSHPAFWLPGQDLGALNMRGQWARAVCKPLGASCESGFDCCEGYCIKNDQGQPVCSEKPQGCVTLGNACQAKGDCCDSDQDCINGFCAQIKP